jgi:hypothetical protein
LSIAALRGRRFVTIQPWMAGTVLSIIESQSPKLRYKVGKGVTWLPRLRQVLPRSLFEKQLRKAFDLDAMK